MDKSTHEEHLAQPLRTNSKQFKTAVIFKVVIIGNFKVTDKIIKFYFIKSITDGDGCIQNSKLPGAPEIESLNIELKRIFIDEEHYTEVDYPFLIKPNFSTLGSIIEISTHGPIITSVPDDSVGDLLGLIKTTTYQEYNLSPNPVDILDILSFENTFLVCNVAQGMIFKKEKKWNNS